MANTNTKHDMETVIHAIRGTGPFADSRGKAQTSGGVVVTIAKRLGVERQTVYSYMKKWVSVNQAVEDEREAMLDMAEGALYKLVSKGNPTGIIFLLKTRGKERGYVERQEVTGANGGAVNIELVWPDANNTTEST
jgi:hypothetical protein